MIPRDTVLRIARATDNLLEITKMYSEGLGFEVIGGFDGHGDFCGRMLGHPKHHYHLEFTRHSTEKAGRAPTEENLLVYYVPDKQDFEIAIHRISTSGFKRVQAFNSYWDSGAQTFEDLDGYRVVISNHESPY